MCSLRPFRLSSRERIRALTPSGRVISIFLITAGSAFYVYAKNEESKQTPLPVSNPNLAAARAAEEKETLFDEKRDARS
jgi:hypothetical protein